jgi:hypothetical protein
MSKYLKSTLIPSYFMPTMFTKPVLLGDVIHVIDDGVAAKLLSKFDAEEDEDPKPYFVEATKKEYEAFKAGTAPVKAEVAEEVVDQPNTAAPVDPGTRLSSEDEPVLTKDADDAAKAEEVAKATTTETATEAKTAEAPAKVAKPAAKAPAKKPVARPQRKAATK